MVFVKNVDCKQVFLILVSLLCVTVPGFIGAQKASNFTRGDGFWTSRVDETKMGFFKRLTPKESQCEDWYKVTPYIAEFWCTVSNIGLLGVGAYFGSPELIVAGSASVISHAIPKNWLLQIDKLAAVVAATKVIRTYPVLINHPWLIVPIAAVGFAGVIDKFWGRPNSSCVPHVVWHLSAAAVAAMYLQYC